MAARGPGGLPILLYVAVGTLVLLYFKSTLGLLGLAYLVKTNPMPVAVFLLFAGLAGLRR
jgi:hypothetical protein